MHGASKPAAVGSGSRRPRLGLRLTLLTAAAGCAPLAALLATSHSRSGAGGMAPGSILQIAAIGLALLVPLVLVAMVMGRRLSHDMRALRGGLEALAGQGASARIQGRSSATREVTEAFNRMVRRWADSREETTRSLDEATRLNAAMASGMREPLRGIRVDADRLRRDLPARPARRAVESMLRGAGTMEATLRRVMLYASPPRPRPQVVAINEAVEICVRAMEPAADRAGKTLTFDPDPNADRAKIDPDQFHQTIVALVLNALEATGPRGRVTLRTQALGDQVLVAVRDDGPGVPLEELEAIFRPFYTTKKDSPGLGLAFSRKFAEAHRGSIIAMNVHPSGLEVGVRLPVVAPPISSGWRRTLSGSSGPTSPRSS